VQALERTIADAGRGPTPSSEELPSLFSRHTLRETTRPGGAGSGDFFGNPERPPEDNLRLTALEVKLADLESQMDNVTVTVGGFTFRSVNDCETFVLQHVPGNTYAHFYDIVSLLQRAWGHNHVGVRTVWENTYALKKAGFSSKGEAVILASMDTVLPTCLGELTGKNSENTYPLPGVPTYESWTSRGFQLGRRKDIQEAINRVRKTLDANIKDVFNGFDLGRGVASELLTASCSHWSAVERMKDTLYGEFSVTSNSKDAWNLTSLVSKTAFENLHDVRVIGADLSDIVSPSKRAARILWATLQAHRVMRGFIEADFRNHPKIAPVIVMHLFENRVGRQEVDLLREKYLAQNTLITTQGKALDKLIHTVANLKKG
jgi:hypothetical protein